MPVCAARGGERRQYSTADYCESPESSLKRAARPLYFPLVQTDARRRAAPLPRCSRKQYRWSAAACYHRPRAVHSFPDRRIQRPGGRRGRVSHLMEETTSVDERKSATSYSSILTVDVSREMEAVNRDIEEIIRRCDDYCPEGAAAVCKRCCRPRHRPKFYKGGRNQMQEPARIMSLKRIPLEKMKEIPLSGLKPRPPRQLKEKSHSAPHTKYKTSRDIRNIVEETDALLRNVYRELSRGKPHEEDGCRCTDARLWGPTCLERYLGCQNKCRRIQENRWFRPKWKDVFEKGEFCQVILPRRDMTKRLHDTDCCLSEPTTPSRHVRDGDGPKRLKDAAVNTETVRSSDDGPGLDHTGPLDDDYNDRRPSAGGKYPTASRSADDLVDYVTDDTGGRITRFKHPDKRNSRQERFGDDEKDSSLLLDRDMGLALDKVPELKVNRVEVDLAVATASASKKVSDARLKSPETFVSHDYFGGTPRSGAGDSVSAMETSKAFVSQIINKIVNKPFDLASHTLAQTMDAGRYEKAETDTEELDTGMCLEIMRRLVDLMAKHHSKQIRFLREVPTQYARVRKIKQQHLINIDKEINSILDLEFYLRNASPARN